MMQNFPTWKEALYRQVLFIFRATKHIYEKIDNLHVNYHYIYSEELLSPFANSNKTQINKYRNWWKNEML